ncbi:MAG: PQ-loop repeat-containing protein [Francisella sp.]
METFGYITLNISFIIYCINFLPQTIHNQIKHKTFEISLLTHSLMIIANSFDLIYAIGFNMQWQYILVDIILLIFLIIQQFQILNDNRQKKIYIHTLCVFIFLFVVLIIIFLVQINNNILLLFGVISSFIYNVYWLPQIYKNYHNKQAEGFSIFYLSLTFFGAICDISSGIFLDWPLVSIISSSCLSILIFIQIMQYIYYKQLNQKQTCSI